MGPAPRTFEEEANTRPAWSTTWATPWSLMLLRTGGRSPATATASRSCALALLTPSSLLTSERSNVATRRTAPATSTVPTRRVASAVVRTRTDGVYSCGRRLATVGVQPVPDHADRLQAATTERFVDALAQLADVHLDYVRVSVEGEVPDVVEDHPLRQHLALPAEKELQHRELSGCHGNLLLSAGHPVRCRIQAQIPGPQHRRPLRAATAHQRAEPRDQHLVGERFGQEVVRSRIQRLGLFVGP